MEDVQETTNSSAPRALISRSRLADAAAAAIASGGALADLRGDAYGHGIHLVAAAVLRAGAQSVLVDSTEEVEQLAAAGSPATTSGVADVDASLLYGLRENRPVMRLVGRVMSTKLLRAGEAVSYGYSYRAPADRRVALVTGGYAQGIVRALGNHAGAEVAGVLRPIVGRVAMDVSVIDLGDADATVGDEVTFFGGPGPAARQIDVWAAVTGMTAAELITVAGRHADRVEEI